VTFYFEAYKAEVVLCWKYLEFRSFFKPISNEISLFYCFSKKLSNQVFSKHVEDNPSPEASSVNRPIDEGREVVLFSTN